MSAPAVAEAPAPAVSTPEASGAPGSAPAPAPVPQQMAPPPAPTYVPQNSLASAPSASLYVGELDPTVTEAMLFEIFNMIGPVASIRVCRDAVTRRSLGYAYVNYLNANDGERALEQLNYSLIKNRACRIMWSQRDPALRKTGQGNIFIKNLDEAIDNKALHDTFAAFGNVLSCKVATDEKGNSKGYGFVHYETAEAANAAIEAVNGMLLNDKKVYVGHHISRKERQSKLDEMKAQFTNLYVKNLDPEMSQEEFENLFAQYGTITSAVVQVDEEGRSKGFGFVNFEIHEEAQKAVDALHDTEINGRKLFVSRAQKRQSARKNCARPTSRPRWRNSANTKESTCTLRTSRMTWMTTNFVPSSSHLALSRAARLCATRREPPRALALYAFSAPDEATKAVAEMNNKMIGTKPLYVSLAQRREVRRQQLESQIAQRNQIRMQQAATAGMPGYMNGPMYYPPGPGFPPQNRMMGYGQPGMMPPRPRYPNGGQVGGMPIPAPYGQAPPQGYGMPGYPGRGGPRGPPGAPRGPGSSPTMPNAPMPRNNGPAPANGAPRAPGPQGQQQNRPPTGPAAQGGRAPQQNQQRPNTQARNAPAGQAPAAAPAAPEISSTTLANASPMEQKQMLGEVIYMKIAASQPELAGKITGMLLEMDNTELLHLLENPEALNAKVQEALIVLQEYAGKDEGGQ
ncbi:Protein phosphatase PP2A regulatory subunit B [Paramarasmius palmivorus]|uniref:Polyadenylate-binding protein n=1 Tax=Paramarasmius palmivorus TaxID=297713 RepID=A0AAW0DQC9_9AGAR